MDALKVLHRASVHVVAEYLRTDESRVRIALETLTNSGIVEAGGTGRGRYYMLGSSYYQAPTMLQDMSDIRILMLFAIENWYYN